MEYKYEVELQGDKGDIHTSLRSNKRKRKMNINDYSSNIEKYLLEDVAPPMR